MGDRFAGKRKKGFMTPERKKKLRLLLIKKAREKITEETEQNSKRRREVVDARCGQKKKLEGLSEGELKSLCNEFHKRISTLENEKYDLEKAVENKGYDITDLNISVNDSKGKFIKPTLKKAAKYENKFAILQKKAAEFNLRNRLKSVKKKEFSIDEDHDSENKKPDWAKARSKSVSSVRDALSESVDAEE